MSVTRRAHSLKELRLLIAQLERSGLADERPEARALLERSRALLAQQRGAPHRLSGKLAPLLTIAVDVALLAAMPVLGLLMLAGQAGVPAGILAMVMPAWAVFRLRRHLHWLGEAAYWTGYHLAWGWDWVAEAFSLRAMDRIEARRHARDVMSGWRQHRRALSRDAALTDVADFLTAEYGPQAGCAFRRTTAEPRENRKWSLPGADQRNKAGEPLIALRWSSLIKAFRRLAASGALWPDFQEGIAPHGAAPDEARAKGSASPAPPPAAGSGRAAPLGQTG